MRELWTWADSRTGERVSLSSTYTREQAERELDEWRARDARGGRPDLHELLPYVVVIRLSAPETPRHATHAPYALAVWTGDDTEATTAAIRIQEES